MPVDPAILGIAMTTVSQGANAFQQYVPKLADIRKSNGDPEIIGDVRMGEVAAVALTMGVGVIASSLTGSPTPAVVAAIICISLVILYESALRADRPFEPPNLSILRPTEYPIAEGV